MDIHVQEIRRPGSENPAWLFFQHGQFPRPLAILSQHEMRRAFAVFAAAYPKVAKRVMREVVAS